ncbi:large tegument protein [Bifidobacterium tissieri]|uniref:Large tegument protein n=2 Tax=Bifidobacterium tissieri TaxID=1630162 RepID=A0A261FEJ9_9BIFI|nr:large tegument protein [Bifidobacterium tissieri]
MPRSPYTQPTYAPNPNVAQQPPQFQPPVQPQPQPVQPQFQPQPAQQSPQFQQPQPQVPYTPSYLPPQPQQRNSHIGVIIAVIVVAVIGLIAAIVFFIGVVFGALDAGQNDGYDFDFGSDPYGFEDGGSEPNDNLQASIRTVLDQLNQ